MGAMLGLFLGWQAGGLVSGAPGSHQALEGKWKIEMTPDEQGQSAGEKGFKDVLNFKVDETFNSEELKKRGFKDGKYEPDQRPYGPAQFKATLESEKQGTTKWTGVATGQNIKGELVWTKKDGSVVTFRFEGERK